MEPSITHRVAISGCSSGTSPLSWAQIDELPRWDGEDPDEYATGNVRGQTSLLGVADIPRVLAAIRRVLGRHEALRTRFQRDAGGDWFQVVASAGEVPVAEFTADADAAHERLQQVMELLAPVPFGPDDLPVRIAIVTVGGAPTGLAVVLWHLVADGIAAAIVGQEVRRFGLNPDADDPVPWQPREIAAFERGPDGRRQARRADRYLRKQLRSAPIGAPPVIGRGSEDSSYYCTFLESPATAAAAQILAGRHGITPVTAVLTGYVLALAGWVNRTTVTISLACANRDDPRLRHSVANLAQFVPVHLDLGTGRFADACHIAGNATLLAYRYGRYDPERYHEARRDVERDRGAPVCLPYPVNLRAIGQVGFDGELPEDVRARSMGRSRVDAAELRAMAAHRQLSEFRGPQQQPSEFLAFTLWELSDVARMMVRGDSWMMAAADPGRLLAAVETTMVDAACDRAGPE